MTDLRDKVKEERSFLKKIELAIPGFRGYRKREDLRIADSMLRDYLARILDDVERYAKDVRAHITKAMLLDDMEEIGKIVNYVNKIASEVRHAEQGYMGLVSDYRVGENELNRLYEFDYTLITNASELLEFVKSIASESNVNSLSSMLQEFEGKLGDFEDRFRKRRDYMLEVFA